MCVHICMNACICLYVCHCMYPCNFFTIHSHINFTIEKKMHVFEKKKRYLDLGLFLFLSVSFSYPRHACPCFRATLFESLLYWRRAPIDCRLNSSQWYGQIKTAYNYIRSCACDLGRYTTQFPTIWCGGIERERVRVSE